MYEVPESMKKLIRKYQPVNVEGLTLYPITVADYEEFLSAAPSITFLQRCLDSEYQVIPLLSAFYKIDYGLVAKGEPTTGLFAKALVMLALSLRLWTWLPLQERIARIQILEFPDKPGELKSLRLTQDGETEVDITPRAFSRLRYIIAAQNGIEIPDEDTNPDLLEAERDLNKGSVRLDENLNDLFSTVALFTGTDETEMDEWPILRLIRSQKAINRMVNYIVCGIGQTIGGKFKGGNPYPSVFYDRVKESDVLKPLSSVTHGRDIQVSSDYHNPNFVKE